MNYIIQFNIVIDKGAKEILSQIEDTETWDCTIIVTGDTAKTTLKYVKDTRRYFSGTYTVKPDTINYVTSRCITF